MKKIFLTLVVLVMALCASAQKNQYFWYQGNLMMGNPIAQVDSVTFGTEDTDSILIYLPRTIIKTVEIHDTVYITIHDTVCPNEKIEGVLPGEFSVSATKKVHFSSGNLQFNAELGSHQCADGTTKQGTWRFAEQQYDYVGKDNEKRSATYSGWIDLFCWGTSGYNNKYPYMDSYYYADYGDGYNDIENTYYDWGLYNEISNDGGNMGKWYTLNKDEWNYLFNYRTNANQLCCVATIDTIKGCLLFPDNWNSTDYSFIMNNTDCSENILTFEEWKTLEKLNVVFLPAAGRLQDEAVYSSQSRPTQYYEGGIVYWSTIHYSSHSAYGIALPREDWTTIVGNIGWRYYGTPVRLVIPVE